MFYVRKLPKKQLPFLRVATLEEYYQFLNKTDVDEETPPPPTHVCPPLKQECESIIISCEIDPDDLLS